MERRLKYNPMLNDEIQLLYYVRLEYLSQIGEISFLGNLNKTFYSLQEGAGIILHRLIWLVLIWLPLHLPLHEHLSCLIKIL